MKRNLLVLFALVLTGCIAFAESQTLGRDKMKGDYTLRTVCVDGYKFVVANRRETEGGVAISLSVTQFFEEQDGKSIPAKCPV